METETKKQIKETIIIILISSLIVIGIINLFFYIMSFFLNKDFYDENKTYEITLYNNNDKKVTFYVTHQINSIIKNFGKNEIVSIFDPRKSTHINLEEYELMEIKEFKNGN